MRARTINLFQDVADKMGIPVAVARRITRLPLFKLEAARREDVPYERPVTRGDCGSIERPCPFVSCTHNLYLDVLANGSIKLNFPDLEPDEMKESCALDVADRGGATLNEVGDFTNLTRERVRQVETRAFARMRGDRRLSAEVADDMRTPCRAPYRPRDEPEEET